MSDCFGETQADQEAYLEHEALVDYMRSQALDERAAWEQEQMERWADENSDPAWADLRDRVDRGDYDDVIYSEPALCPDCGFIIIFDGERVVTPKPTIPDRWHLKPCPRHAP